jgi:hypothetical protein
MSDINNKIMMEGVVDNVSLNNLPNNTLKVKKTRNKPTKEQRFKEPRTKIILELEKLMGLTETNRSALLPDLENNEKLKEYLTNLVPDIQKYYKCGNWGYFSKSEKQGMGNLTGLLKAIFKNEKYTITSRRKTIIINDKKKLSINLYFLLNV